MTDLPKQVDRRVRKELENLDRPWRVVKKKDHYFVQVGDSALICVANNSSKRDAWQAKKTIDRIRKA